MGRCHRQQASQLRASCGREVQQPEGRSPLDCHMAGRAPTKRVRGESHAEYQAPRCRAVPARTHLRSSHAMSSSRIARAAFSKITKHDIFFSREHGRMREKKFCLPPLPVLPLALLASGRTARGA